MKIYGLLAILLAILVQVSVERLYLSALLFFILLIFYTSPSNDVGIHRASKRRVL